MKASCKSDFRSSIHGKQPMLVVIMSHSCPGKHVYMRHKRHLE